MKNTIYTYVVDHGSDRPRVGINTDINGGRVLVVAFDDYAQKLEDCESFLSRLRDETTCDQTKYAIDDFLN